MSAFDLSAVSCKLTTKRLFEGIKQDMVKWKNYGLLKQVKNISNMSEALRQHNIELDNFVEVFQVRIVFSRIRTHSSLKFNTIQDYFGYRVPSLDG